MKFNIGDMVTRPFDVHNHDYDNRRSVRIKGVDKKARLGPHTLIGTVIDVERNKVYMEGVEGQEHKHEVSYSVVWRNWVGVALPTPRYGHVSRGYLEHGIQKLPLRMRTIPEIVYVAKNLATQMREKQLSDNEFVTGQVPILIMQINTLGWVIGKEPVYFRGVEKGGSLDRIGQRLEGDND